MAMGTHLFILLTFLVEVIIVGRAQGGGGVCLRQQSKTLFIFSHFFLSPAAVIITSTYINFSFLSQGTFLLSLPPPSPTKK